MRRTSKRVQVRCCLQIYARARRRRAGTLLGLLVSALVLILPGAALGSPTVIARGEAVPIPGFPHTGNILGAGAAVHAEVKISGTEYGGFPPPLIGITVDLPTGVRIDTADFPTCPRSVILEQREPRLCPKGSSAGPGGKAHGVVAFGEERVAESVSISAFLAPGGGLEFLAVGHTPVSLEIPATGLLHQPGPAGFGPQFSGTIPLIQTVPGAPDASVEAIEITLGTAIRKHGKTYYYGRVPKRCPSGGFRVRSEFMFAEPGDLSKSETVTVPFRAPCPRQ